MEHGLVKGRPHFPTRIVLFTLIFLLTLLTPSQAQESLCVASADQTRTWTEDYSASALELEADCNQAVITLQQSLVGQHGPPLEIEIKNAVCYGPCEGYMLDILYLSTVTGCTCDELDSRFPLSEIGITDVSSWCSRTPARFLKQVFDVNVQWDEFNTFYCGCDPEIGVRCRTATDSPSFTVMAFTLVLGYLLHQ